MIMMSPRSQDGQDEGATPPLAALQLRRAMARNELVLYCQPFVDCETGEVQAAEALIRWQHPTRGLLPPMRWVPSIDTGRVSTAFNLHVLRLAIAHRDAWRAVGAAVPLSVNVSPACLADEEFIAGAERLFADHSPAGEIRLEVTEQATVMGGESIDASVERLRKHGFEFLLDDFGAEYSSLSRLAQLPFSTLKIDGSLVEGLTHSRQHRSIVHAAIHLAHTLGLNTVAERVESVSTWKLLRALGCDQIQGYLIARPMPAAEFPQFVQGYVPDPPDAARRRADRRVADRRIEGALDYR
jgi:EAL domain-containing protein (putative c-di-GMP-specific phosphodiesterase class I)